MATMTEEKIVDDFFYFPEDDEDDVFTILDGEDVLLCETVAEDVTDDEEDEEGIFRVFTLDDGSTLVSYMRVVEDVPKKRVKVCEDA
jgi:hypothetical protein